MTFQSVIKSRGELDQACSECPQPTSQFYDVNAPNPAFALANEGLVRVEQPGQLLLRHADAFPRLPKLLQEMLIFR